MTARGDDPGGTSASGSAPTLLDRTAPAPPAESGPLPVGTTFAGRYHVKRRVGTGGMGAVYQAFDTVLSEDVAIKLIRPEILADPEAAAEIERRFKRELLMGRRVSHPSVVRVHDFGEAQGLRYLTMSYVDGQDLSRVLEAEGPMSPARVVRIGRRVGSALAAVHAAGVIHRDLKPANVMLGRGDQVWLTDFGIARLVGEAVDAGAAGGAASPRLGTLTTLGARIGTPEYMAPEQAAGARVDERTDVYGLGLVLYDLLTGGTRRERYGSAETELQARSVAAPHVRVPAPEVPETLDAVLARALDPDPGRRYASAAALVDALAILENGDAATIGTPAPGRTGGAGAADTATAVGPAAGSSRAASSGATGFATPHAGGSATVPASAPSRPARTRATWLAAGVVAVLALGTFLLVRGAKDDTSTPSGTAPAAASASSADAAASRRSVAVLPFTDLSPERDQAYLADGIAEELLVELSRIPGLRVPGRTSSFYFKDKAVPVAEMGRQLGVAHLLEGSVRKSGDRLRIGASLVRVSDGAQLWSKTFDRAAGDVFAVQDEIAAAVAWAFAITLRQDVPNERPASAEAFDLFLRAQTASVPYTAEAKRAAADLLRQAIAIDPNYARAWTDLAAELNTLADMTKREDYLRDAQSAIERAIALAPDRAHGYLGRASILEMHFQDWDAVRRDLERARKLEPEDTRVMSALAYALHWQGHVAESIAGYQRLLEKDPLRESAMNNLAYLLMYEGRYADARRWMTRALELNPQSVFGLLVRGELELLEGRPEAALAAFGAIEDEAFRLYGLALAEHSRGDRARSDAALRELIAKNAADAAYQVAAVYAWRGENDRAFEWLERARVQRDGGLTSLLSDSILRPVQKDARWPSFVQKVGLTAPPP